MTRYPQDACHGRDRLSALLEGHVSDADSDAMLAHLERCPRCQSELEAISGEERDWSGARHVLLSTKQHSDSGSASSSFHPFDRSHAARSDAWAESISKKLLSPPSHPEMLGRIGRYDIERWIGAGGMGIVFKGFDTELHRAVAIKVLAPSLALNGAARHRFAREARAAAAVVHENVVPIYDVEANREIPYLVMRFIPGESLQSRLDREGPLELKQILRIGKQLAAGLSAAHAQGLIHRDVKPANVLLEPGIDRAMLTDFGLAQTIDDANVTASGVLPGTPQYMSPEQARGDKLTVQSDLFSAGSVLYAMCTGRAPYRAETPLGVLRMIGETKPPSIRSLHPEIPDWMERIVERAMSKHPKDRYASAGELAHLLEECLAHVQQPLSTPLPASLRKTKRWSPALFLSNHPWRVAAGGAIALAGAWLAWQWLAPATPHERLQGNASVIQAPKSPTLGEADAAPSAIASQEATNVPERVVEPIVWKVQPLPRTPEDAILEQLDAPVSVDWNAMPLETALKELLDPIAIAFPTQEAQNAIASAAPVELRQRGTRRQILDRLLAPLAMAPMVLPDRIDIAERDYANAHPSIRRYCLSSIARNSREASALAQMLHRFVEPDAWKSAGGPCDLSLYGPVLIVKGTESMHEEIVQILAHRSNALIDAQPETNP